MTPPETAAKWEKNDLPKSMKTLEMSGMRTFSKWRPQEPLFLIKWKYLHSAAVNGGLRQEGPIPLLSSDELQIRSFCWSTQEGAGNMSTRGAKS